MKLLWKALKGLKFSKPERRELEYPFYNQKIFTVLEMALDLKN